MQVAATEDRDLLRLEQVVPAGTAGAAGAGARKAPSRFGRDELKEVSKKEIDDQIRATMARLSGGKEQAPENQKGIQER